MFIGVDLGLESNRVFQRKKSEETSSRRAACRWWASWVGGWLGKKKWEVGARLLICLFFLLMMSPVKLGSPHACLGSQTRHATLFPMQLSSMSTWPPLPFHPLPKHHHLHLLHPRTKNNAAWLDTHRKAHQRPKLPPLQLFQTSTPFYTRRRQKVRLLTPCVCDPGRRGGGGGGGKKTKKQRHEDLPGRWACGFHWAAISAFTDTRGVEAEGTLCVGGHLIVATTAPPAGGQKNSRAGRNKHKELE